MGAHAFAPAVAPDAVMLADARAPAVTVLAPAPLAVLLADARAPTVLAVAPAAVMLADACPPRAAVLAPAPLAVMLWQIPVPPQSLQMLLLQLCWKMLAPPQSLLTCSRCCCGYAGRCLPPAVLADHRMLLWRLCSNYLPFRYWFAARGRRLDDNRVLHYGASHRAKFPYARPHTRRIEKRCCCLNPSTARFRETETGIFSVDKMVSIIFLYVFQGDFSTGKLRPSLGGLMMIVLFAVLSRNKGKVPYSAAVRRRRRWLSQTAAPALYNLSDCTDPSKSLSHSPSSASCKLYWILGSLYVRT